MLVIFIDLLHLVIIPFILKMQPILPLYRPIGNAMFLDQIQIQFEDDPERDFLR